MTDPNYSLTAKTDKNNFLVFLILSAIPLAGISYAILKDSERELAKFNQNPIGLGLMVLSIIVFFGFFFYKYFFDPKTKLIINKDGVWIYKYGHIKWESVWYIYQNELRGKMIEQTLIIKLNEEDKEIKIDTTHFDKTEEEIMIALKECSSDFNVIFLDKEIQRMK